MKRKIFTFLLLLFTVAYLAYQNYTGALTLPTLVGTARAVGDLTIDWGVPSGAPIFVITNFLPGDTEVRQVTVSNAGSATRPLGIRGIPVSETGNLSQALLLTISKDASLIYGPTPLSQFLTDSNTLFGLALGDIASNQSHTFTFTVTFSPDAGNAYQNSNVVFDLKIGISIDLPLACRDITFSGQPIFGTEDKDFLRGTQGNDLMVGFAGNDRIWGHGGRDCIIGGPGDDELKGDNDSDFIFGDEGNDKIWGNHEPDYIDAGSGDDWVQGDAGGDHILGGPGDDTLDGNQGQDNLDGQDGDDYLDGARDNDILTGGPGRDKADGHHGTDTCSAETETRCEL